MTAGISDRLYNGGLARAKDGNMSGAVEDLKKSVGFNNRNITARNLLGLVYFETGRIGDALAHWVISASIMRENNAAGEYLDRVQKNSRELERLNDAVKMYNGALEYLRQKNDDMAIIQLKKALEINPGFVDASNMLALCYFIQRDKEKARIYVEKALASDSGNEIALRYYKELFPSKTRPEPVNMVKRPQRAVNAHNFSAILPKDKRSFGGTFHIAEIISFLIGGACVLAIAYFLVVPGIVQSKDSSYEKMFSSLNAEISSGEARISAYEERVSESAALIERLRVENEEYSRQASLERRLAEIDRAEALLNDEDDALGAAEILAVLDMTDMTAEAMQRAADLKIESYPDAARLLYDDAVRNYNQENYQEATRFLEKCLVFIDADASYMAGVVYHRGLLAERSGDLTAARGYYETVMDRYSNSNFFTLARSRLNSLSDER
jgi:tetratricopeptide (TPR) repeat protein